MEKDARERELVLPPNSFCHILDETKGGITVYVGPNKTSLANSDRPVIFDEQSKKFVKKPLDEAIKSFATAPEGWYQVLKNPAVSKQPKSGSNNSLGEDQLLVGRKVNIPGPVSHPLWPGQMVKVIQGHHLRSNQYLVVRVYDEKAAQQNWDQAIITRQTTPVDPDKTIDPEKTPKIPVLSKAASNLTMGKLMIVKGTEVSFYIPPTGVEVVKIDKDFIQNAVTLERLEYCILLDENGNKRYVKGPEVVFPEPTEKFVAKEEKGQTLRKYRAKELSEISGIYVKISADYEEDGTKFKAGQELFITGKDTPIYFPREEHVLIKYDGNPIHYASAIPAGEGRYLLNRLDGSVKLIEGPKMLLADPRKEVLVRRILDLKQVELWFPHNKEAISVNQALAQLSAENDAGSQSYISDSDVRNSNFFSTALAASPGTYTTAVLDSAANVILGDELATKSGSPRRSAARGIGGDKFDRKDTYTPPRTLTLDTKYDGAVSINIWTGYAINVVSKTGSRKTIKGPTTYLLAYDEALEGMELSTGTPKSDAVTIKTAYLRTLNNKTSDEVKAESQDLCQVSIKLSYRVDFTGDSGAWFNVENYVGFLTGNMRSKIRNCVKRHGIQEFYADSINIIRDLVLGVCDPKTKVRPGCFFEENGMRVTDVEVLDVTIGDEVIADMLVEAQSETMSDSLEIAAQERRLTLTKKKEEIERQVIDIQTSTTKKKYESQIAEAEKRLKLDIANLNKRLEVEKKEIDAKLAKQKTLDSVASAELARDKKKSDQAHAFKAKATELKLLEQKAKVEAFQKEMESVSPQLVAAIQSSADKQLVISASEHMSPYAMLGGESLADSTSSAVKPQPPKTRTLMRDPLVA